MPRKSAPEHEPISFETALDRLKSAVRELESGELTLEVSLKTFEQGIKYLKECHMRLDEVEKRLRLLVDVDEEGRAITKEFHHQATAEPRKRRNVDDLE